MDKWNEDCKLCVKGTCEKKEKWKLKILLK